MKIEKMHENAHARENANNKRLQLVERKKH